jgi:penicillin-binding protein 1A
VESSRLASEPVGPMVLGGNGVLRWNIRARQIQLELGRVGMGEAMHAFADVTGQLELGREPSFVFATKIDKMPYQAALDALPPALAPGPGTPRLEGGLSAQFQVGGPLEDPDRWIVDGKVDLSGLKDADRQPLFLKGAFLYKPVDGAGTPRSFVVGPTNPSFVPVAELPGYVPRAVLTSEDAGFFAHQGFDFEEMKNSLAKVAEAGRAVRGGSTLTQQLAKNLFLSREKTLARKVREALITIALEASLPKQRLLEIYLNVIEWGPGIYGIGQAARHYFGKDARRLNVKEAAFLATIIPNPNRYYVHFTRGHVTPGWENRISDLLSKMRESGRITDAQLLEAFYTPLVFSPG